MAPGEGLCDGRLVTLLVGIGLTLIARHAAGCVYGPIHPAHVTVGPDGRPHLSEVTPPAIWTPHDDWVALLRLGRHLGTSGRAAELSWRAVGHLEGEPLLRWLLAWANPAPLDIDPASACVSGRQALGERRPGRPRSSGRQR